MRSFELARDILLTSCREVFSNWGVVLRLVAVPMLLPLAALLALALSLEGSATPMADAKAATPVAFLLGLILAFGTLVVAVGWHRFILNGEVPGWRPPLTGPVWSYLGASLVLLLATFLVMLVLLLPAYPLAEKVKGSFTLTLGAPPYPFTTRNLILSMILMPLAGALLLKLSVNLPAVAIGQSIGLREGFRRAGRLPFGTYWLLGLFLHIAPMLLNRALAEGGMALIAPFLNLAWFMLGIALVTQIFARLREGNPALAEPMPQA